ncbi:MAG: hypothetical protein EOM83_16665 [Clostridia bacterium]|nr:hypothetical protein [Clostridia bacterium]
MQKVSKKSWLVALVAIGLLMQSCINIVEEVTVRADRSGSVSLRLDAGGGNPLMTLLGRYVDLSFMDDLEQEARTMASTLRYQPGISQVNVRKHGSNGVLELSFDFADSRALNHALYAAAGAQKTCWQPAVYKTRHHSFVRTNTTGWLRLLAKEAGDEMPDEALAEFIDITSIYHVPSPVRHITSSTEYACSADQMTVTTTNTLADVLDKNISSRIKIRY